MTIHPCRLNNSYLFSVEYTRRDRLQIGHSSSNTFTSLKNSPRPATGVHVQDLFDGHHVSRDDGIEIRIGAFLITVEFRDQKNNQTQPDWHEMLARVNILLGSALKYLPFSQS